MKRILLLAVLAAVGCDGGKVENTGAAPQPVEKGAPAGMGPPTGKPVGKPPGLPPPGPPK